MNRFMTFIKNMRQNEKASFMGTVVFFYLIFLALWLYFLLSKDSAAPTFIYEQF